MTTFIAPNSDYAIYSILDDDFVSFANIFIRSLKKSNPDHPPLILLYENLSTSNQELLQSHKNVFLRKVSFEPFKNLMPMVTLKRQLNPGTFYARYYLWQPNFDKFKKILFLDLDMIVVGSLDELWKINEFTANKEAYSGSHLIFRDENDASLNQYLENIGLNNRALISINAGMFLLPRHHRTQKEFEFLMTLSADLKNHLMWADQSVIAIWLAKKGIIPLVDYVYNFQINRLIKNPRKWAHFFKARIIHFNGMRNPKRLLHMKLLSKTSSFLGKFTFICFFLSVAVFAPALKRMFKQAQHLFKNPKVEKL